jgi:hypothetical protein
MKYLYIPFLIFFSLRINCFSQSVFSDSTQYDTYFRDKESSSFGKKYVQTAREHRATLFIRDDSTFEYFYSNTDMLSKYSIGKIKMHGPDSITINSDTSLMKESSDLIRKHEFCYSYLFQFFDNKLFFYSDNKIVETWPLTKKTRREPRIRISSFIECSKKSKPL